MKVDILAIGVHPDDIELGCGGTIFNHLSQGKTVALCDLTQGELGSRGSAQVRLEEADKARQLFNIPVRENLGLPDGFIKKDKASLLLLIETIRALRPEIILANAIVDRHPDHGRAADFITEASFLSGLLKIETQRNTVSQAQWRPKAVYHYIQDYHLKPDIIVDISSFMDKKMEVIKAYGSQFYDPTHVGPETPISGKSFLDHVEGRAKEYGRLIGVTYGEGFTVQRPIGISNLLHLL